LNNEQQIKERDYIKKRKTQNNRFRIKKQWQHTENTEKNVRLTTVGMWRGTKGILARVVTDAFQWTMPVLNVLTRQYQLQSRSTR
jgi:hypothetical protein